MSAQRRRGMILYPAGPKTINILKHLYSFALVECAAAHGRITSRLRLLSDQLQSDCVVAWLGRCMLLRKLRKLRLGGYRRIDEVAGRVERLLQARQHLGDAP